ncbi:EscU/YscU/HrcU family type III secretion system export apparatus switch protein [Bacillus sp. JJ1503]|uniref:EscU/YscU/HrcU family type III secretion system export apparatus switch protein n=1 Tax=unclassified Bacillus (in: firmicutes) TaxID=185979 RepID=UPI002FFF3F77
MNPQKPVIRKSYAHMYYEDEQRLSPADQAKQSEKFAQKLIESAQNNNIPLQENSTLLKHLIEVDLGDSVPPQLYALISEILGLMKELEKE